MLKKIIIISLIVAVASIGLCGCMDKTGINSNITTQASTGKTSLSENTEKIKITDMLGREVEVPKEVNRIVAIGPGCLRLITYLNATDKVVGVEDSEKKWSIYGRPYRIAHPEFANLPTIGKAGPNPKPYPEEIIKVNPDVIFACYITKEQADDLQQKTGIPVVVLSYGRLATFNNKDLFKSIELAGKILGKEERAEEVIKFIKDCLTDLNNRTSDIPDSKKPKVYVGGIGFKGMHGIESTSCNYPPFMAVNAKNVVDELNQSSHVFINKEQLLKWDPDIIFIDEGGLKLVIEDYKKNPDYYNSLKAFKNGNVYGLLPYNFYTTNVGTALADAYFIGKVIYPDRFEDIDPEKKADEIYTFLVGKPVYSVMKEKLGGFKKLEFK
ncbi:iron ABC transporter substrate-binding protein [Methanotorris igneus]|uniref:ABC-type transporter, periplasmic subunit n=1 Tax=Methanotorris igneus (strain DSM 5666 / JCM 11834 / Kol 5) TaxID=880724 RepID=F6BAY0_METIK|nr:iron ABC transporter substrate-binding protein [Methanotorris igneus]AEF97067.1 ABC-type transporter, periplasmic subunit [Methanotorris igneus Kol 5]